MSTELQKKLNQFEVTPPENCWSNISVRLDSEYSIADTIVATNLANSTANVPADAWQNIAGVLDTGNYGVPDTGNYTVQPGPETTAPVIQMRTAWLKRIAAVFVLVLGVASVYRYISEPANPGAETSSAVVTAPQTNASVVPSIRDLNPEEPAAPRVNRISRNHGNARTANRERAFEAEATYLAEATSPEMCYANIENAERPLVDVPITVSSAPIRDASGNIIMDEKLVSSPDNNYVTVTGPNGEQTKMSKEFFRALSYLNADSGADNTMGVMLQESSLWKWLFQEWRARLIQGPTFIPSSTNFLDILEMKDLLNDQL